MTFAIALISIALPWLNPFSPGPSPTVVPWLFSAACATILIWEIIRTSGPGSSQGLETGIATAWLVAAVLSAAMGLFQYFGATALFGGWVSTTDSGEVFANLRQRNQFATLTNIGLVAVFWWLAKAAINFASFRFTSGLMYLGRVSGICVAAVMAMLLAVGIAASSSRTGLLQLILLTALACIWCNGSCTWDGTRRWSEVRSVVSLAALTYIGAALYLPILAGLDYNASGIVVHLNSGEAGCSSRLTLWANVLHLIGQKPWLGWGWGELDYAHFITLYPGERFCDILDNAHNLPLHLAVELGIPVALLFSSVCLSLIWRAKPWCETNATRQMAWSVLALIGVHSMLEYPLWYGPFQMAVGLSVWLLWRTPVERASVRSSQERVTPSDLKPMHKGYCPLPRTGTAWLAMLAIAFLLYVGWDYWRVSQIYLPPAARAEAYRDNTLAKISGSWLFKNQLHFAELTTTPLTPDTAAHVHALAKELLHFSPEARVVQKLVESAVMLGNVADAQFYLVRYQAAFTDQSLRWAELLYLQPVRQ